MRFSRVAAGMVTAFVVVTGSIWGWATMGLDEPRKLPYQGYLEQGGAPAQGTFDLRFALFLDQASAADCLVQASPGSCGLWWEQHDGVPVAAGRFAVNLGESTGVTDAVLAQNTLYLAIAVRGSGDPAFTALAGKSRILPVPWAVRAAETRDYHLVGDLDVDGQTTTGSLTAEGPVTVSTGGANITGAVTVTGPVTVGGTGNPLSVSGDLKVAGTRFGAYQNWIFTGGGAPSSTAPVIDAPNDINTAGLVAATDGMVSAWIQADGAGEFCWLSGMVKLDNAWRIVATDMCINSAGVYTGSVSFPVKKGTEWKVYRFNNAFACNSEVWWLPYLTP